MGQGQGRVQFGTFVLDLERGMLFDNEMPVAVGSKGLALLTALVEARGETVTKAALMEAVWPGAAVEESNLSVQIAQLRKRLGKSPDSEEWIATVPRVGYRFIGGVRPDGEASAKAVPASPVSRDERPSVAVLPFNNMSSDPEQEYFADGLSEDLITDLSKVPGLLVIARNSSFAYKGRSVDVRQIARELGVRYVVEGSVRRNSSRIRINAQIIDSTDHSHLWADRFDRDLADVFALQDEIVGKIVSALAGALPAGIRVASQRSTNLEAYDLAVRGRVLTLRSPEDAKLGRALLEQAIRLDPQFAEAYAWLAMGHMTAWAWLGEPADVHRDAAVAAARLAVSIDPQNADALANLGNVLLFSGGGPEAGRLMQQALRANPNHADAWVFLGDYTAYQSSPAEGIEFIYRGFRLNPHAPGWYYWVLGHIQFLAGRYDDAVTTLRHPSTVRTGSQRILAAALAELGRLDEAKAEAAQFLEMVPAFSAAAWARTQPFSVDEDRRRYIEAYLKAGLPM